MHNQFAAECIKLKHKKVLLLIPIALVIGIVLIVRRISNDNFTFIDLYIQDFPIFSMGIQTIVLTLVGISIFYDEFKDKTITYIATTPISPAKFVVAKLMIMGMISLILTLGISVLFSIAFIMFGDGSSIQLLGSILCHLLYNTVTFTLAVMPILLFVILLNGNALATILVSLAYSGIIILHNMGMIWVEKPILIWLLDYIHPLGNAISMSQSIFHELVYRFAANPEIYYMSRTSIVWPESIGCIIIVPLLCIIISVLLLKRKNYD